MWSKRCYVRFVARPINLLSLTIRSSPPQLVQQGVRRVVRWPGKVFFAHDMIAVENTSGPVATQSHSNLLGDSGAYHVADCAPT
jgi:hypothetical protein